MSRSQGPKPDPKRTDTAKSTPRIPPSAVYWGMRNHDNRMIIEIAEGSVELAEPVPFVNEVRPQDMEKSPPIKGKEVKLFKLITNGKECGVVAAAKGLLPGATSALKQYHQTLAGEQALTSEHMPQRLRDDCDLAENVFRPGAYLELGFPVFHRNSSGRVRRLKSLEENYAPDRELFAIPEGYRRLSPAKLRAGG